MKILFFIESLRAGGKERRIVELLKGLKTYPDIEIALVLTREEIHYAEIYELNIPIYYTKRKYIKKDPLLFLKFFKVVKNFKPDLIHVWGVMVGIYAIPSVVLGKIPMINNMITNTHPEHKWRNRLNFKFSTKIIANSLMGLKVYEAPRFKSEVVYNGFNFQRIEYLDDKEIVKEKFKIRTSFVVGMVATFSDNKDYDTYIKAALDVSKTNEEVTFLCIGEGDDATFKAMVPEQFKSRILFLGKQNNVEQIMNICNVGVLSTNIRNHGEGISNALMEFMAIGKPVIATNFGGSGELIENNRTGFLIDAFDPKALKDRISFLFENRSLAENMGMMARERIKKEFDIELMVKSFYKTYLNTLNNDNIHS